MWSLTLTSLSVHVAVRFTPIRPPQLHLKPIFFEVPHPEGKPLFIGREWVFREMEMVSLQVYGVDREGSLRN